MKVLINAFPVSIKEKWHIEKKTSIQYKSNNGINVIFSTFVSFIYYSACIIFWKKTVEVLTKSYLLEHTMVCTLNWDAGDYTKPKQLIEQINLSVNIYSQPISHMRMESLLKMFPLKNDYF